MSSPYLESRRRYEVRQARAEEAFKRLEYEAREYKLGLPFANSDEAIAFLKMLVEVGKESGYYYCCDDDGWQIKAHYASRLLAIIEAVIEHIVGYSIKHLDFYKDSEKGKINMILKSSPE